LPEVAFRASRCFRKELSRVILAFSTRIASVFVDFCVGCGARFTFPTDDIIGITADRIGCILIGPLVGLVLGMMDNAFPPILFNRQAKTRRREPAGLLEATSMQRGSDHVLKSVPCRVSVPVLTGDADPYLAGYAAGNRLIFVRVDEEKRGLALAML
jgi:hypothetical protein